MVVACPGDRNTAVRWTHSSSPSSSSSSSEDDDKHGEEERAAKRPAISHGNKETGGGPLHDLLCIWRFPFVYREPPVDGDPLPTSRHDAEGRTSLPAQDQAALPAQNSEGADPQTTHVPDQDRAALPDENHEGEHTHPVEEQAAFPEHDHH
jgi:hypothetical protein